MKRNGKVNFQLRFLQMQASDTLFVFMLDFAQFNLIISKKQ